MNEPIFDHGRLDVHCLSIKYLAFSYRMAKTLGGMGVDHNLANKPWASSLRLISRIALASGLARLMIDAGGMHRPARDQWLRAAQSIPLNIAEGNGKQSSKVKNRFFEIALRWAQECASIHNVLAVCDAIDVVAKRRGKSDLKRIVSILTQLSQRTETVSVGSMEYEYRDAEYEYEEMPEQNVGAVQVQPTA
jgi:four helix bundle protein